MFRKIIRFKLLTGLAFVFHFASLANSINSGATVKIHIPRNFAGDTLTLIIWDEYYLRSLEHTTPNVRQTEIVNTNGDVEFIVTGITSAVYFSLGKGYQKNNWNRLLPFFAFYILEPGDEVSINITSIWADNDDPPKQQKWQLANVSFIGKNKMKFRCMYTLSEIEIPGDSKMIDSVRQQKLNLLQKSKKNLSTICYKLLWADIIGEAENKKWQSSLGANAILNSKNYDSYLKFSRSDLLLGTEDLPTEVKRKSKEYFENVYNHFYFQFKLANFKDSLLQFSDFVARWFSGKIREKIMLCYVVKNYRTYENSTQIEKEVKSIISSEPYLSILRELEDNLLVGSRAALHFNLWDQYGASHNLKAYEGKIILIDFWYVGCMNCVEYYKNVLSKVEEKFRNDSSIVFITISIDNDKDTWINKGLRSGKYTSDHVINLYTGGKGFDHPIIRHYRVDSYPRPILIGQNGTIVSQASKILRYEKSLTQIIIDTKNKSDVHR